MISGHEENQAQVAARAMASDMWSGPPLCSCTTCYVKQQWQPSHRHQGNITCTVPVKLPFHFIGQLSKHNIRTCLKSRR